MRYAFLLTGVAVDVPLLLVPRSYGKVQPVLSQCMTSSELRRGCASVRSRQQGLMGLLLMRVICCWPQPSKAVSCWEVEHCRSMAHT